MDDKYSKVFIPTGVYDHFSKACDLKDDDKTRSLLMERVNTIVTLYESNNMQAFWSPGDTIALHVIITNHLLNRPDSRAAISDLDKYEHVYSKLYETLNAFITERKRDVFTKLCSDVTSGAYSDVILGTVNFAIEIIESKGKKVAKTDDDKKFHASLEKAVANQLKDGWALVRLCLVRDTLTADGQ
jgi:hypothetical protein